ncbi:restriction endonuclease subunit S [Phocaeicola vulgatus]|uniref:restriction endonuclease subunit S n=1 Tax=Phocaeicola vulgatus TaxID=821 RepID=UPI001F185155|nr:restriction endonuclease subunit S [Phocaeicola vulgatus]
MKIKDIVRFHSETTMPIPDVVYHLYSLPSFDNNQTREELLGQDIQSNKFTVPNRCILFNKLNVRFKRIWRIDSDEDHKIASTEFLPLIIDENKVDFAYCFYLLASPAITDYLCGQNANTSGSHKRIDPTNFFNIGIKLPPLAQQYEIGKLLSSLDAKIKLNRQINQNLEAMAKQLYDYWFVQFDFPNEEGKPYKSSGGKMIWNDRLKREIPVSWNNGTIKNFMKIFTGKKDVSKAIPGKYKFFSCAPEPITSNEFIYDGYAVLVSGNGSYTGRVGFYKGKFDLYQRTYACVLDENQHDISFFYYTLKYLFQPIFSGGRHGSSIPYIVLGDLADFNFAFNENVKNMFVNTVKSMFDEQLLRQCEIEELTKQRDELLPLLMNGQVSVNSDLSDD